MPRASSSADRAFFALVRSSFRGWLTWISKRVEALALHPGVPTGIHPELVDTTPKYYSGSKHRPVRRPKGIVFQTSAFPTVATDADNDKEDREHCCQSYCYHYFTSYCRIAPRPRPPSGLQESWWGRSILAGMTFLMALQNMQTHVGYLEPCRLGPVHHLYPGWKFSQVFTPLM